MADIAHPPSKRDLISTLPAELLQQIFDDAWSNERPYDPLNWALCAWYDRYAWRRVRIEGLADVEKYVGIFKRRPWLPSLCYSFLIDLSPKSFKQHTALVEDLLRRMPRLRELELSNMTAALFERLVPMQSFNLSFPALESLSIKCTSTSRQDPYHPSCPSSRMARYPHNFDRLAGQAECDKCPALDLTGVLRSLRHPESMKVLVLDLRPGPKWRFPREMRTLRELYGFVFAGRWQRLSLAAYDTICDLEKLRRIRFSADCDLDLDTWIDLIGGDAFPNLGELCLDNVVAQRGERIDWRYLPKDWDPFDDYCWIGRVRWTNEDGLVGWRRGQWTKSCTVDGVERLIRVARVRGLKLSGSTFSAWRVEQITDEFDRRAALLEQLIAERQDRYADWRWKADEGDPEDPDDWSDDEWDRQWDIDLYHRHDSDDDGDCSSDDEGDDSDCGSDDEGDDSSDPYNAYDAYDAYDEWCMELSNEVWEVV
ncbi:hypothetical protein JCM10908_000882 [Rhodotorula pacifica]|uniref:uncharacterized protein n=1 Tax=Rhodotorula pacifica TaxID=1495444 RepID=UPI00317C8FAD